MEGENEILDAKMHVQHITSSQNDSTCLHFGIDACLNMHDHDKHAYCCNVIVAHVCFCMLLPMAQITHACKACFCHDLTLS